MEASMVPKVADIPVLRERLQDSVQLIVEVPAHHSEIVLEDQRPGPVAIHEGPPCPPVGERAATPAEGQVRRARPGRVTNCRPSIAFRVHGFALGLFGEEALLQQLGPGEAPAVHGREPRHGRPQPGVGCHQGLEVLPAVIAPVQIDEEARALLQPRPRARRQPRRLALVLQRLQQWPQAPACAVDEGPGLPLPVIHPEGQVPLRQARPAIEDLLRGEDLTVLEATDGPGLGAWHGPKSNPGAEHDTEPLQALRVVRDFLLPAAGSRFDSGGAG
mmetsp:Transcript_27858/g.86750  ORF Transcript_27858/g.86750 Transcript_27858/m.86750 type:complete len:274 (+) Transcript_27858:354-1175(+)